MLLVFAGDLPGLREEVALLLEAESRRGVGKTAGVCPELLSLEASLWTFARVAASCRARNRDVMGFLTQDITAHHRPSETPSLLPQGV